MKAEILISGFGGQGLMSLGKILAKAAVLEGKYTVFIPSYGAEMRGGTAHCFVKISDSSIASPFVEFPDTAIIFNQPSLVKFRPRITKEALVILNSDLIHSAASKQRFLKRGIYKRRSVSTLSERSESNGLISKKEGKICGEIIGLPLNKMALGCGDLKTANIIALGVLRAKRPGLVGRKAIISVLKDSFKNKASYEANLRGFELGENYQNYRAKA